MRRYLPKRHRNVELDDQVEVGLIKINVEFILFPQDVSSFLRSFR